MRCPEIISLKENANIKIIVDEEGHLLTSAFGNTLPSDKPSRKLSDVSFQQKVKRRQAYSSTNIIHHILSKYRNCYLCKNNLLIDSEIKCKIKRALADNITKGHKDESMKNKAPSNVNTTFDSLSRDKVNEFNSTNNKTHIEPVAETISKSMYDNKM